MTHRTPQPVHRPSGPVLALDLGGTRTRAAVVGDDGTLLSRSEGATPGLDGPEAVLATVIGHLRAAADAVDAGTRRAIRGVGMSTPGPVDPARGIILDPPNVGPGFRDVPIADRVVAAFGLPAVLERDTHVAALAEGMFGAARGLADYLYITVSTGLGGAIVARGRLYGGADGVAGEIGHLPVAMDGPPCGCGGRGHLEAFSSGSGIARRAQAAIASGNAPALHSLAAQFERKPFDARPVFAAADAGDGAARAIVDEAIDAFAAATIGLVNVFNPDRIVVGGGLADALGNRLLGPARDAVAAYAFRVPRTRVRIVAAALGGDVGLVGGLPLVARAAHLSDV
jgi:glucokinase